MSGEVQTRWIHPFDLEESLINVRHITRAWIEQDEGDEDDTRGMIVWYLKCRIVGQKQPCALNVFSSKDEALAALEELKHA